MNNLHTLSVNIFKSIKGILNSSSFAIITFLTGFILLFVSLALFINDNDRRNEVINDQMKFRGFITDYLPYYQNYDFNILNYLMYHPVVWLIYIINIITILLIIKILITGRCSFRYFKGKKFTNIVSFNLLIYFLIIPFYFELILFLFISIILIVTIIKILESTILFISNKFNKACNCENIINN
jgi:hypothetical protein